MLEANANQVEEDGFRFEGMNTVMEGIEKW